MKNSFLILVIVLMVNSIFAQDWKVYPYTPQNSLISFPVDEGYHKDEPTEWWYTFAHLKGKTTNTDYTVMLTFISRDTLVFNGLRIFNISNENTKEFFHDGKPYTYITNATEHQEIKALVLDHNESWVTKKDANGNLIPFNYNLKAKSPFGEIDLDMEVIKRPLILADSGFLYQGSANYTYYYSFTSMKIEGTLTLNGNTEEVIGTGWFDKQYGNFHPEVGEKYEWLSIQLSNGMDINTWNIFTTDNKLPESSRYRMFNSYVNDSTFLNTSDFNIERLGYYYSPDSMRIYGRKFRITQNSLDLDIEVTVQNPNCEPLFPFPFYEGPTTITGKVKGENVTGKGFAELLHFYEDPIIEFIEPSTDWNAGIPLKWTIKNPDEGRPLRFDIELTKNNSTEFIAENISDTFYFVNSDILKNADNLKFTVTAKSIDELLTGKSVSRNIVSNHNIKIDDFDVYPTLFDRNLTVKSNYFKIGTKITLLSQDGKSVYQKVIDRKTNEINIQTKSLKKGLYLLYITYRNSVFVEKLIHSN